MRRTSTITTTTSHHCGGSYTALDWCSNTTTHCCDPYSTITHSHVENDEGTSHQQPLVLPEQSQPLHTNLSFNALNTTTVTEDTMNLTAQSDTTYSTATTTTTNTTKSFIPGCSSRKKVSLSDKLFRRQYRSCASSSKRTNPSSHTMDAMLGTSSTTTATSTSAAAAAATVTTSGTTSPINRMAMMNLMIVDSSSSSASTASLTLPDDAFVLEPLVSHSTGSTSNSTTGTFPTRPQAQPSQQQQQQQHDRQSIIVQRRRQQQSPLPSHPSETIDSKHNQEERFLGPIDLDTLSEEEEEDDDENGAEEADDDKNDANCISHLQDTMNHKILTTTTSDVYDAINSGSGSAQTNSNTSIGTSDNKAVEQSSIIQRGTNDDHIHRIDDGNKNDSSLLSLPYNQSLEATQPLNSTEIMRTVEESPTELDAASNSLLEYELNFEDFVCVPDCSSFLLSSMMMSTTMTPTEQEEQLQYTDQYSPTDTTSIADDDNKHLLLPSSPMNTKNSPSDDVQQQSATLHEDTVVSEAQFASTKLTTCTNNTNSNSSNNANDDKTMERNPSMTTFNSQRVEEEDNQNNTGADPLLLLLQKSSYELPKRNPNELDSMLSRVLYNGVVDEDETIESSSTITRLLVSKTATTTRGSAMNETSQCTDEELLMEALAAGPVDVDDFIPEDSYWAMDTHEFVLDEIELSRQLIGYQEGCEPPMINDVSLLADEDDGEEEVKVIPKRVYKNDVRQDLILQQSNMIRQRTTATATADSAELIRRAQMIQHRRQQQQRSALKGVVAVGQQRPAAISSKNRIRSDPSVTSMPKQYPMIRFPTPTGIRQHRQQPSPQRGGRHPNINTNCVVPAVVAVASPRRNAHSRPTASVMNASHDSNLKGKNARYQSPLQMRHPPPSPVPQSRNWIPIRSDHSRHQHRPHPLMINNVPSSTQQQQQQQLIEPTTISDAIQPKAPPLLPTTASHYSITAAEV
jgi:hypothetical protein